MSSLQDGEEPPRHRHSNKIKFIAGDLFTAPHDSILVHACNTQGSWGAGIALTFKSNFPKAFQAYNKHCQTYGDDLRGSCFLIPADGEDGRTIACLFTSRRYGKGKDKPRLILEATESALKDLKIQNSQGRELYGCRFNSGKFAVPWEDTQRLIEDMDLAITIYDPPNDRL